MKKIIKILLNILSAIAVFSIIAPIVVSIALTLTPVQNIILKKATSLATEFIGSPVKIGHIDIKNRQNISIKDIYIKDPLLNDTLINVEELKLNFEGIDFKTFKIVFNKALLKNGFFRLNQYGDTSNNIKYLVDKIKNKNQPKNRTHILFNDLDVDSINFQFNHHIKLKIQDGINYSNLNINNICGNIDWLAIDNDIITGKINDISLNENNNINVRKLSMQKMHISPNGMKYDDFSILMDNSKFNFNSFEMHYENWDMIDFVYRVPMTIDVKKADIDFKEIAKFTTKKRKWSKKIETAFKVKGTVNDFEGVVEYLKNENTIIKNCKYHVTGIPIADSLHFDIIVDSINTNILEIHSIVNDFAENETLNFITDLEKRPDLSASGSFIGKLTDFNTNVHFHSTNNHGEGNINLNLIKDSTSINIEGNLDIIDVNVGDFYTSNKLGEIENLTTNINFDGSVADERLNMNINAFIDSIYMQKRNITNISIDGKYDNGTIFGELKVRDKEFNFDFNGLLSFIENKPIYNAKVELHKINLYNLGVIKHDPNLTISAKLDVEGAGKSLDDIQIKAEIEELILIGTKDSITSKEKINAQLITNNKTNSIVFESEYMNLSLKGVAAWETIKDFVNESIEMYTPVLMTNATAGKKIRKNIINANIDEQYVAELNLKKHNKILEILIPTLTLSDNTKASMVFNPYKKTYSINIDSKSISYKGNIFSNLIVNSTNKDNHMNLNISAHEILYDNIYIPNVSINTIIFNDELTVDAQFINDRNNSQLEFKSNGVIIRDSLTNKIEVNAQLLPSFYRFDNRKWNIDSGKVDIYSEKININNINIVSENESFNAHGVLSKLKKDTLNIRLKNFNIAPISVLLKKINLSLEGNISGTAKLVSGLSNEYREVLGRLFVNNLAVNKAKLPNSRIEMKMNKKNNHNEFSLINNITFKDLINGNLSWENKQYNFNFILDDFNPIIISPFLKNIASDINGNLNAQLNISNNNADKKVVLNGDIFIDNISMMVDYTKVVYNTSGLMSIRDNLFSISNTKVFDQYNGYGNLDLMLNIDNKKGFQFDIKIEPNELLALNTQQVDNPFFYGDLFTTGDVRIHNTNGLVSIEADVKSAKKSKFYFPLSHNTNITNADFIKYVKPNKSDTLKTVLWDLRKEQDLSKTTNELDIKLNVDILDNTEIEIVIDPISGSTINTYGNGDLLIHINPQNSIFNINGDYNISKGTYKFIMPNFNLVNKTFTIDDGGWIRFNGNPLNATINIDAIYKVKASLAPLMAKHNSETETNNDSFAKNKRVNVNCVMNFKDNLMKPNIVLGVEVLNTDPETNAIVRSELNTPEAISNQFIFLLLSNSFLATEIDNAAGTSIGVLTGIEFLNNRVREFIASDKFDFSLNYMPKTGLTSDEVSLSISAPLYKDRVFLDVQGNFNFMNNEATVVSKNINKVSGEFYLTWVINETGNLKLKGFSRTIDTFDENQGLQETGIGVYFKEEFNKISELTKKYKAYINKRRSLRLKKRQMKHK